MDRLKNQISVNHSLILASSSPRRKYLLEQAGIAFMVAPADIKEQKKDNEPPQDYVRRLSREKAGFIARQHPDAWVLGADTVVVMGDQLLEKPASVQAAVDMLTALSGNTHTVYTGFTLCCRNKNRTITGSAATDVTFKTLTKAEIQWYVNTKEPFDKAGAYAIQGLGTFIVKRINGSYTNVVGLPVCEVIETLIQENIINIRQ
ncbi:MAG: Maf family protein [Thermodesulfobacteriota bacterium]|nr:Maf family protein [Thermodesulfobacteriota bacterium]